MNWRYGSSSHFRPFTEWTIFVLHVTALSILLFVGPANHEILQNGQVTITRRVRQERDRLRLFVHPAARRIVAFRVIVGRWIFSQHVFKYVASGRLAIGESRLGLLNFVLQFRMQLVDLQKVKRNNIIMQSIYNYWKSRFDKIKNFYSKYTRKSILREFI